jgi:hypothetical protein
MHASGDLLAAVRAWLKLVEERLELAVAAQ